MGATPNANGASLTGQALNLQPADATNPGVVTAGAQTFGGAKTYNGALVAASSMEKQGISYSTHENNAVATGANATATTPTKEIVRLTNGSLTSLEGITAPAKSQKVILVNTTGAAISILEDTAATAADGFLTGTGADLSLEDGASISLFYDLTSARWRIVGGSGSGGGGGLTWATYNFDYTMLSGSTSAETFAAAILSGKYLIVNVSIKTTTAFDDNATLSAKHTYQYLISNWLATGTVASSNLASVSVGRIFDTSTTPISLEVTSGSGDTANITQGACQVLIAYTEAP